MSSGEAAETEVSSELVLWLFFSLSLPQAINSKKNDVACNIIINFLIKFPHKEHGFKIIYIVKVFYITIGAQKNYTTR